MRYLDFKILIVAATILVCGIIGIRIYFPGTPAGNPALAINDRIISIDELERLFEAKSFYSDNREEFINSLITKEILIQEAMHQGIDREEAFRRSVQHFFEHSLIKTLLDRKYNALPQNDSKEMVARYEFLFTRTVRLTRFSYKPGLRGGERVLVNTETVTSPFEELSMDIKCQILALQAGESTKGETDPMTKMITEIRFDSSEDTGSGEAPDRALIRKIVTDCTKGKLLSEWIADLKNQAHIKIWDAAYGESEDEK